MCASGVSYYISSSCLSKVISFCLSTFNQLCFQLSLMDAVGCRSPPVQMVYFPTFEIPKKQELQCMKLLKRNKCTDLFFTTGICPKKPI